MPTIGILAAGVFGVFSATLVLPILASLLEANWRAAEAMLLVLVGYGFLSSVIILALYPRRRTLNRAGVFTAAIAIWLSYVVAAMPVFILVEGHNIFAAFFEASSAAVTLGTTIRPAADISAAMAFYRATTAWMGGLMTLAMAVYVLGPYQVGGTPNMHLRRVQHARTEEDPRVVRTLLGIAAPYMTLTLICAALLVACRVPADDAIVAAMSALSTNGFVPAQIGSSVLANPAAEIVMIAFMIIGGTSIIWHRLLVNRVFNSSREHEEGVRYLSVVAFLILMALLSSAISPAEGRAGFQAALNSVFDIVSIATTTGITHDVRQGIGMPFEVVLLIVFIGGCSYSTAGGIKAFRLLAMLRHVGNELERLVYPSAVLRDDVQYDPQHRSIAKAIWSAFFLAVLTITIAILLFAAQGHALPNAMALAAGAFSQVGNVVSEAVPGLSQGAVSDATLLTIGAVGLVARIEILVVLAALTGKRW